MIRISQPLCFSEIGQKSNQEDSLFPQHANTNSRIFILCDGMGGHEKGEVASSIAANALGAFLENVKGAISEKIFNDALDYAYNSLDEIKCDSGKTPGTTMTCLCFNDDSYLVAHIGDSRIYHIRPALYSQSNKRGGILYQTSDHSLVNDLLKAGELTEDEAKSYPQKNIITRAMQPHLDKRYKADIFTLNDIANGDYFFLCCDGILEQITNEILCEILSDDGASNQEKLQRIKHICDGKTKDNYTCWLIQVDSASIVKQSDVTPVIRADFENEDSNQHLDTVDQNKAKGKKAASKGKLCQSVKSLPRRFANRITSMLSLKNKAK